MKTEFQPIPITILDFLGVLLPGWIWLFLICATLDFISTGIATPKSAWLKLASIQDQGGPWLGPLAVIFAALIVGYAIKPLSMQLAQYVSRFLFKLSVTTRSYAIKEMVFPYNCFFFSKPCYAAVAAILMRVCGCDAVAKLPGKAPFSPAKRYLRLLSPVLWEESERMEAEVRMIGGLFLSSLYTALLSCLVVFASARDAHLEEWVWLVATFATTIILGVGFNHARLHEVENTYMNILLAEGCRLENKS